MAEQERDQAAFAFLFTDLVVNILALAESPSQCCDYITRQVRELIGVRTVVIMQCTHCSGQEPHTLLSVFPERRRGLGLAPEMERLAWISHAMDRATPIGPDSPGEVGAIVRALDLGTSLVLPLHGAGSRMGVLFLLGVLDPGGSKAIVQSLDQLGPVLALILRNAHLYANLEQEVLRRTADLARSEATLREYIDNAPDGVFLVDETGRYLDVNPAACRLTGYSREELLGMGITGLMVPEEVEAGMRSFRSLLDTGRMSEEFPCLTKGGDRRYWLVQAVALSPTRYLEFASDVTARRRTEAALERRLVALTLPLVGAEGITFQDLFNLEDIQRLQDEFARATGVASIITHPDGTPITAPSNFCRLCRDIIRATDAGRAKCYQSDAVLGRACLEGPTVQQCMSGGLWDAGAGISVGGRHIANWLIGQVRDETQTEERMRAYAREIGADEEELVRAFHEVPSMSRQRFGDVAQALFTLANQLSSMAYQNVQQARFISERGQVERMLTQARDEAEAASRSKSEFLANMSHEIRTPLNGVLGMLQLMQSTALDQEQAEYAQDAIQASRRLTRLLSDILDLSRVEAGKLCIRKEPFDLADTLRSVEQLFSPSARQKGVVLELYLHPRVPRMLEGDAARLQQILANLMGNALKFTDQGRVLVEAYPLPPEQSSPARVLFAVSDTGCGIPEDRLDTIFEPFTQVEGGVARTHQGAGLGLAISNRLVALMGGRIAVETQWGIGTTFYVCIDFGLAHEPLQAPAVPEPPEAPGTLPLTLLLVEDERVNRISYQRLLEKMGHRVLAVENGRQALEALAREAFDAVLMDVQMPVMDGLEATRIIRHGPEFAHRAQVPVIALTAYAMAGDRESLLASGMDDYLSKPVDLEDLRKVLARVTQGRGRPGEGDRKAGD